MARRTFFFFLFSFFLFFRRGFVPGKGGEIRPFAGRLFFFFRPFDRMEQAPTVKKKVFLLTKRARMQQKKIGKKKRTWIRARTNITEQTYGTEEVMQCTYELGRAYDEKLYMTTAVNQGRS